MSNTVYVHSSTRTPGRGPPSIDLNERIRSTREIMAQYRKLTPMRLPLRQTISAFQWISALLFAALGVLAIVDISLADPDPAAWVYDDEDEAILNGAPYAAGAIPWYVYIGFQAAVLIASLFAAILEWYVYGFGGIGLDLMWPPLLDSELRNRYRTNALLRARQSWSLYGVAYNDYYFSAPLLHIATTGLFTFHLFAGRQTLKFTSVWAVMWIVFAFVLASCAIRMYRDSNRMFRDQEMAAYREVEMRTPAAAAAPDSAAR